MTVTVLTQNAALELIDLLFDVFQFLDPEDTQLSEMTHHEREGYKNALGDLMVQFNSEDIATVVDMRDEWPENPSPHVVEAKCTRCGEIFNPGSSDDLIHLRKQNEQECGGFGLIAGVWS